MKPAPFIYVMQRGFVLVGRMAEEQFDSLTISLNDVAIIANWGTTQGLGELAVKGPLAQTRLHPEPDGTEISRMAIYRKIPCDQKAWSEYGAKD